MTNPIYVLLSKQTGLRRQVDLIANNVANLGTTGFKREGMVFAQHVERLDVEGRRLAQAEDRASFTDHAQGPLTQTGNALDVALEGDGFLAVEAGDGTAYTRDGRLSVNPAGELVTVTGHRVLDEGGAPVLIPAEAAPLTITGEGMIASVDGQQLGRLGVFALDDDRLRRDPDGLFRAEGEAEPRPAETTRVVQGFIEGSNVGPVRELVDLIEAQRAYERGQDMIASEDERVRRAVETLGRAP